MPRPVSIATYTVRKDNTISFKGNLYSLPLGTYQGRGTFVAVRIEQDELVISIQDGKELCRHRMASGKGLKIINTDHKRDKSSAINEMIEQLCALLQNPEQGKVWLTSIRSAKPRYIRDQLMVIRQTIQGVGPAVVNQALDYCLLNNITSAADFKAITSYYQQQLPNKEGSEAKVIQLNPLSGKVPEGALRQPNKSSIEDYQSIIKKL